MSVGVTKCVFVIGEDLPAGLAANTAAVLAVTLGQRVDGIVGPDVLDQDDQAHTGLTMVPLPILKAPREALQALRQQASAYPEMLVVDVSEAAQRARTYDVYRQTIASQAASTISYLGIALYGEKTAINRLTRDFSLL